MTRLFLSEAARYRKEGKPEFSEAHRIRDMGKGVKKTNDANYFVQFSNLDKLGINPKYGFNTPRGLYFYPVTEKTAEDLAGGATGSSHMVHGTTSELSSFANERKYTVFAKLKDTSKILYVTTYTKEDYQRDIAEFKTLVKEVPEKLRKEVNKGNEFYAPARLAQYLDVLSQAQVKLKHILQYFPDYDVGDWFEWLETEANIEFSSWRLPQNLALDEYGTRLAYDAEYAHWRFYNDEYVGQGAWTIFTAKAHTLLSRGRSSGLNAFRIYVKSYVDDAIKHLEKRKEEAKKYSKENKEGKSDIDLAIRYAEREAKNNQAVTKLWNVTRLFAEQDAAKWSSLLMKLGYEGVVDQGDGLIHPSEPHQAVFFSIKPLQYAGAIKNKLPDHHDRAAPVDRLINKLRGEKAGQSLTPEGRKEQINKLIAEIEAYDVRGYHATIGFKNTLKNLISKAYPTPDVLPPNIITAVDLIGRFLEGTKSESITKGIDALLSKNYYTVDSLFGGTERARNLVTALKSTYLIVSDPAKQKLEKVINISRQLSPAEKDLIKRKMAETIEMWNSSSNEMKRSLIAILRKELRKPYTPGYEVNILKQIADKSHSPLLKDKAKKMLQDPDTMEEDLRSIVDDLLFS